MYMRTAYGLSPSTVWAEETEWSGLTADRLCPLPSHDLEQLILLPLLPLNGQKTGKLHFSFAQPWNVT